MNMTEKEKRDRQKFIDRICEMMLAFQIVTHGKPHIVTFWCEVEDIAKEVWDKIYSERYQDP